MIITWRGPAFVPPHYGGSAQILTWSNFGPSAPTTVLVWGERVQETSRTKGTGAITLLGAAFNKRAFSSVLTTGDYCYGFIASQHKDNMWEVNLFQMQSNGTLTRANPPIRSSNAGALVDFDGSTLDVVLDVPATVLAVSLVTPGYTVVSR
jgi:hypothetical protein